MIDDEEYIDDDLDIDLDGEDYLEDDEILVPESEVEDVDEDYIYERLQRRNSPHTRRIVGSSLTDEIVANESGGNYKALNPHSSATGKYQFLWNTWGDKISKVTGVKSKQEFLNNPEAQDMFYNEYYVPNEMMPAIKKLKKYAPEIPDKELGKLYHYQGLNGSIKYLTRQAPDVQQSYNAPISKYTGIKRQVGGGIQPLKTNFKTPSINNNYQYALSNDQRSEQTDSTGFLEDVFDGSSDVLGDIGEGITKVINVGKKIGNNVAQGLSTAIDMGEQFTSEQNKNQQYRKMMQQLYGDNPSNYAPVTQRINNNPVLI